VTRSARQRIAQLEQEVAKRDARIGELTEQHCAALGLVRQSEAKVAEPEAKVAQSEARLGQNSSNSSLPPSSDKRWNKAEPKARPAGERARGGQKGHAGHQRAWVPAEQVRQTIELRPERCEHCGSSRLAAAEREPLRHQVTEIPPPAEPVTDEYRRHACRCQDCGRVTWAELPAGVPRGGFGPGVIALVALLGAAYRLSRRNVQRLLWDVYRLRLSLGGLSNCEQEASEAVAGPVQEARGFVEGQAVVHADETSMRQAQGAKAWLWVAATALVTVFLIRGRRTAECARELLGKFLGIPVADRYSGYGFWPDERRQFCWSHLAREFKAMVGRGGLSRRLGEQLMALTRRIFELWHQYRGGSLSRAELQVAMRPIREQVEQLIPEGADAPEEGLCRALLPHCRCLWTFVEVEGVEPTNNLAERQLRHGVILRKTSFGTRSERGSRYPERMLTVVATLRQQERDPYAYLSEACRAHLAGRTAPSLLPTAPLPHA
jgi:transposase